ncbi:MAG: hypothetical protein HOL66_10175 [Rhodospirillaceae bacterium]|jgi:hypothetical protein|nr:hypothetical protein [Rhodospirillaceae bacterium]MBT5563514.1 hypothetical protein [Rhodospirillaceae bacterium]MBT6240755.1 hypothetical protein [Rhodospirillaceae bacterium]MBT7137761.1 hypothetical protein [Rhodospirillaceae bacterium]
MTVSRVNSLKFCLAVALVAVTSSVPLWQTWAQNTTSAPVRLAPPQKLRPVAPTQAPAPVQAPAPAQNGNGDAAIQVDTLQTINPDTAGVLGAQEGGFGVDMWSGTSHRMLLTLITRLPVNLRSEVMRDLMRRLLLSTATLPGGMTGDGTYVARRVGLLAGMGDTLSVSRLLDATPGRTQINQLMRYEADVRFLANDNSRACSLAAGQISNQASVYWQKAFIFCQALAGEHDKASLGVSLLQETGDQDNAFYTLVEALRGNTGVIKTLPDPSPMHLSMARVSKSQLPADVVSSNRPGVLRTIAKSPNASVEIRLEAAERAEIAGALDVDTLRQLYTSVSFSEQDMANPLTKAEAESGPLSRALLYRTALIQTVPIAQAEATAKALSLGREGDRYTSTVRVFLPVLKRIPPSTELVWFAPEVIRAFLIGGEDAAATPWFSLLRANAQHNMEAAKALNALLPVARIAGSPETSQWGPTQLANWWNQLEKDDSARDKAALLYTLFDALGDSVPQDAWDALLDGPQQIAMAMPNPALWRSLNEATKAANMAREATATEAAMSEPAAAPPTTQGSSVSAVPLEVSAMEPHTVGYDRVGEIILLSLIALGEGGPGQAGPIVLRQVMDSLSAIGLEKEVHALALEAAVAAGL